MHVPIFDACFCLSLPPPSALGISQLEEYKTFLISSVGLSLPFTSSSHMPGTAHGYKLVDPGSTMVDMIQKLNRQNGSRLLHTSGIACHGGKRRRDHDIDPAASVDKELPLPEPENKRYRLDLRETTTPRSPATE